MPPGQFFSELKRRRVFRVAAVYAVVAWAVIEVADTTFPYLRLPEFMVTAVIALAVLGFPVAMVLAWAFQLTAGGVRREDQEGGGPEDSPATAAGERGSSAGAAPIPVSWRIAIVGAVLVLGLAGAAFLLLDDDPREALIAERVVVLPLENRTGDPSLDPVGRLAADWITQGISRSGIGQPVPLTDLLQTLAPTADPSQISAMEAASAMGAGTVVAGSYYLFGDRLEFQARVLDARKDALMEAVDPVSANVHDPREGIQTLRQQVTGRLATRFDPRGVVGRGSTELSGSPPTLEAYEAFADGMDRLLRQDSEEAIPLLLEASRLDTTFLHAKLRAAIAHLNLGDYEAVDSLSADVATNRSRLSSPDRLLLDWLQAHLANDRELKLDRMERLAALFPNSANAYGAGAQGVRFNRPRRTLHYLGQMDPTRGPMTRWAPYWRVYADAHHLLGDHETELEVVRRGEGQFSDPERIRSQLIPPLAAMGRFQKLRESLIPATGNPDWDMGDALRAAAVELRAHGHRDTAAVYLQDALDWYDHLPAEQQRERRADIANTLYLAGDYDRARPLYEAMLEEVPAATATPTRQQLVRLRGRVGTLAAHQGKVEQARRIEEWLESVDWPYMYGGPTLWQARMAAVLGERDRAAGLLRQALYSEGAAFGRWVHTDPDFLELHGVPAFEEVLRPRGSR